MTPATRNRSWLGVGLIVSLALNAFFIGAAATDVLNARQHAGQSGKMRYELRWLAGRLSDENLAAISAAVADERPKAEQHIDRLKALRNDLGVLLAEPEPDRAAIDAQLAEIRAELGRMVTETQATTTDALLALPADVRANLADPPDPVN